MYQFQSWAQFCGKAAARGGEELAALRQCERVWSVLSVLNYLRFLADKSGIAAELAAPGAHDAASPGSTMPPVRQLAAPGALKPCKGWGWEHRA